MTTHDSDGCVGKNVCGCGKFAFVSRRAAKRYAKRWGILGLSAYRHSCGYFHLGHLPAAVKRGRSVRDQYRRSA